MIFQSVEIKDDRVEAFVGPAELHTILRRGAEQSGVLVLGNANGSEGAWPSTETLSEPKRRGSVARRRYGEDYIVIAEAPPLERVGRSKRAKLATPRTSIAEPTRERIRQLAADGWSLREIAEDVGVSHESVRKVLRSNRADVIAAD